MTYRLHTGTSMPMSTQAETPVECSHWQLLLHTTLL